MTRREHWSIAGDILATIDACAREDGNPAHAARIATLTHLAYDRLLAYLDEFSKCGLVALNGRTPLVTGKGYQFLLDYRIWSQALETFGLAPHADGGHAKARSASEAPLVATPRMRTSRRPAAHDET